MAAAWDEVVDALRVEPSTTAIVVDFDGTLSPIVEDPAAARPQTGVHEALSALTGTYRVVAVVSGRSLSFLRDHLPAELTLAGLYGLERLRHGEVEEDPAVAGWRPIISEAAAAATAELPAGVDVEDKGLSLTLHVRRQPQHLDEVVAWVATAEERWGLQARSARMSRELHPPVKVDKGTVVDDLIEGCTAACFIGDDVGDLPAFAALDRFAETGGAAHRIVVSSPELAPEMAAAADLLLDGPAAVVDLLRALAPAS